MIDRPTELAADALAAWWRAEVDAHEEDPAAIGIEIVDHLRAAAGCVPGQPLVILDNGELTTAEPVRVTVTGSITPPDAVLPTFWSIPGAEEARP